MPDPIPQPPPPSPPAPDRHNEPSPEWLPYEREPTPGYRPDYPIPDPLPQDPPPEKEKGKG